MTLPDARERARRNVDRPQRSPNRSARSRPVVGRRAGTARSGYRGGGHRARKRTPPRRAEGSAGRAARVAGADRRGRSDGTTTPGAQPARRRPTTAHRTVARAEPARGAARRRSGSERAPRSGAAGDRDLARGASRGRAWAPPGRRQRTRPCSRARTACRACRCACPADRQHRLSAARGTRGSRVLPRLREPRERRQVRARVFGQRRGHAEVHRRSRRDHATTESAAPTRAAAPGYGDSRTVWRRSVEGCACGARSSGGTRVRAEIPCAP